MKMQNFYGETAKKKIVSSARPLQRGFHKYLQTKSMDRWLFSQHVLKAVTPSYSIVYNSSRSIVCTYALAEKMC